MQQNNFFENNFPNQTVSNFNNLFNNNYPNNFFYNNPNQIPFTNNISVNNLTNIYFPLFNNTFQNIPQTRKTTYNHS